MLSIRPEFTDAIHSGSKRYEYRRKIFSYKSEEVLIYCTSPVKRIVSKFKIANILCMSVDELWEVTGEFGGIDERRFRNYFSGLECGYAIEIDELEIYAEPVDPRLVFEKFSPPQSFIYVNEDHEEQLSLAL